MEWIFIVMVTIVLWLIERQFNVIILGIKELEGRVDNLSEEVKRFKK